MVVRQALVGGCPVSSKVSFFSRNFECRKKAFSLVPDDRISLNHQARSEDNKGRRREDLIAESMRGPRVHPSVYFDELARLLSQESSPAPNPAPLWRPVGWGQLMDELRSNRPGSLDLHTREIQHELATVPGLGYGDSWLVPQQRYEYTATIVGTSSQRPSEQSN
uniref:Uncharacterized protein n=1 Tax=Lygus hesperus TaxID=30085 RepID=A0A146L0N3_LYGHE